MKKTENYFLWLRHLFEKGKFKQGIPLLRITLGIIFIWFGILKILSESPVAHVIKISYDFLPFPAFLIFLGIWEVLIGLGLIFKIFFRITLILLWLQIAGTFGSVFFAPSLFFNGNPFLLTLEGEFLLKNLVILAASIVIGGYKFPEKV